MLNINDCLTLLDIDQQVVHWITVYGSVDAVRQRLQWIKANNYELLSFDMPSQDEDYVTAHDITIARYHGTCCAAHGLGSKRFIVRKKQPRRFVFEEVTSPAVSEDAVYDIATGEIRRLQTASISSDRCVRVRLVEEPAK
jgi:hypothetical protein